MREPEGTVRPTPTGPIYDPPLAEAWAKYDAALLRSAQALVEARKRKAARDKALAARKARRANR